MGTGTPFNWRLNSNNKGFPGRFPNNPVVVTNSAGFCQALEARKALLREALEGALNDGTLVPWWMRQGDVQQGQERKSCTGCWWIMLNPYWCYKNSCQWKWLDLKHGKTNHQSQPATAVYLQVTQPGEPVKTAGTARRVGLVALEKIMMNMRLVWCVLMRVTSTASCQTCWRRTLNIGIDLK